MINEADDELSLKSIHYCIQTRLIFITVSSESSRHGECGMFVKFCLIWAHEMLMRTLNIECASVPSYVRGHVHVLYDIHIIWANAQYSIGKQVCPQGRLRIRLPYVPRILLKGIITSERVALDPALHTILIDHKYSANLIKLAANWAAVMTKRVRLECLSNYVRLFMAIIHGNCPFWKHRSK